MLQSGQCRAMRGKCTPKRKIGVNSSAADPASIMKGFLFRIGAQCRCVKIGDQGFILPGQHPMRLRAFPGRRDGGKFAFLACSANIAADLFGEMHFWYQAQGNCLFEIWTFPRLQWLAPHNRPVPINSAVRFCIRVNRAGRSALWPQGNGEQF